MQPRAKPYALRAGEGWTYNVGIDFTLKAGERGPGRRLALVEYATRSGEEPGVHTHDTEDEIFYVLRGALTFNCGDQNFDLDDGGFIFLPRGVPHGYTIRSQDDVRLLVLTSPADEDASGGWGGFVADIERDGTLRAAPP